MVASYSINCGKCRGKSHLTENCFLNKLIQEGSITSGSQADTSWRNSMDLSDICLLFSGFKASQPVCHFQDLATEKWSNRKGCLALLEKDRRDPAAADGRRWSKGGGMWEGHQIKAWERALLATED